MSINEHLAQLEELDAACEQERLLALFRQDEQRVEIAEFKQRQIRNRIAHLKHLEVGTMIGTKRTS